MLVINVYDTTVFSEISSASFFKYQTIENTLDFISIFSSLTFLTQHKLVCMQLHKELKYAILLRLRVYSVEHKSQNLLKKDTPRPFSLLGGFYW